MTNFTPGVTLAQIEKIWIQNAMSWSRGNKTQAAQALGISYNTLCDKLKKYEEEQLEHDEREKILVKREQDFQRKARSPLSDGYLPVGAEAGTPVEPPNEIGKKQTVPMPQRKKVQALPLKPPSSGRDGPRSGPHKSGETDKLAASSGKKE